MADKTPVRRVAFAFIFLLIFAQSAAAALRTVETRYYRIHADLPSSLVASIGDELDRMHVEYARRLAGFGVPAAASKCEIYLFENESDYVGFVGEAHGHSGGVFMPDRNAIAAYLGDQGRDRLRAVLRHEGFHQFAHAVIDHDIPVWLNEGIAQLFEEGIWVEEGNASRLVLGQVPPTRLRRLLVDGKSGKLMPLDQLMALDSEAWWANMADPDTSAMQYNLAWAAAHFLVYDEQGGDHRLRRRLLHALKLMHAGYGADVAMRRSFGDDYRPMQSAFLQYCNQLRPTAEATALEHQRIRADMIRLLHGNGITFKNAGELRRFADRHKVRITYQDGTLRWQSNADPARHFVDHAGNPLPDSQLFFSRAQRSLPDLICRPGGRVELVTRFHRFGDHVDHETVVRLR
ncbi:MAG: DUF1570 domain-containing protein [Planctomycetota bacterium]